MTEDDGLICAYLLDGQGGGRPLDWSAIRGWQSGNEVTWMHLNRTADNAARWLREESGLAPLVCEALLAEETRPRTQTVGDGILVNLRGVNLNPGADPEDMVSVRLWVNCTRIISLRAFKVMAIQDIRDRLENGHGPGNPGDFLVDLAGGLLGRMGSVIQGLGDSIDELEDEVVSGHTGELRIAPASLRRQAIALHRHVGPQRDALSRLQIEPVGWLTPEHRGRLREAADRVTRYVEDLDAARDRAAVTHEELVARLGERTNRAMYILSLVASIFLPLGLITGLLGINVAGIPGAENHWAFALVCILLLALAGFQIWLFRRKHWL